jgi:transposase
MQQLLSNLMVMMDQFMNNRIMFTRIYVNLRLQSFYFSPINYCLWNTWKLMNIVEFKFLWILFSINPIDTKNENKLKNNINIAVLHITFSMAKNCTIQHCTSSSEIF